MPVSDLLADLVDFAAAVITEIPGRMALRNLEQEVLQQLTAGLGVCDFRMKLDAVAPALAILERGNRGIRRRCRHAEAGRLPQDPIAVAGPDALMIRRIREQRRLGG